MIKGPYQKRTPHIGYFRTHIDQNGGFRRFREYAVHSLDHCGFLLQTTIIRHENLSIRKQETILRSRSIKVVPIFSWSYDSATLNYRSMAEAIWSYAPVLKPSYFSMNYVLRTDRTEYQLSGYSIMQRGNVQNSVTGMPNMYSYRCAADHPAISNYRILGKVSWREVKQRYVNEVRSDARYERNQPSPCWRTNFRSAMPSLARPLPVKGPYQK